MEVGGRSGTPTIEVPIINGNIIEVTCQFMATNPNGGFSYNIKSVSSDTTKLTRRADSISQLSAGWQSFTRTDYFVATLPNNVGQDDATFEVEFSAGGLSNPGQVNSFILIAKIVGSKII